MRKVLSYLKEYDLSDDQIKDIINTYDNVLLKNLNFSKRNVKEIIKYNKLYILKCYFLEIKNKNK